MEGSRRVLIKSYLPDRILLHSNERLDRVDGRIQICLARRNHAGDSPKEGDGLAQKSDLANDSDVLGRLMVGEDSGHL